MSRLSRQRRYLVAACLVDIIVEAVAEYYGMAVDEIRGARNQHGRRVASRARHIAMFTIRVASSMSYHDIDRLFGRAAGATLYAVENVTVWIHRDTRLKDDLLAIARMVAERSQPQLAPPQKEAQRLLSIAPQVMKQITESAGSAVCSVESLVDGSETPVKIVAAG